MCQLAQIQRQVFRGQIHISGRRLQFNGPKTGRGLMYPLHLDGSASSQTEGGCGGRIDHADFRAGIEQEIQRTNRLGSLDLDPQETFGIFKRDHRSRSRRRAQARRKAQPNGTVNKPHDQSLRNLDAKSGFQPIP